MNSQISGTIVARATNFAGYIDNYSAQLELVLDFGHAPEPRLWNAHKRIAGAILKLEGLFQLIQYIADRLKTVII